MSNHTQSLGNIGFHYRRICLCSFEKFSFVFNTHNRTAYYAIANFSHKRSHKHSVTQLNSTILLKMKNSCGKLYMLYNYHTVVLAMGLIGVRRMNSSSFVLNKYFCINNIHDDDDDRFWTKTMCSCAQFKKLVWNADGKIS